MDTSKVVELTGYSVGSMYLGSMYPTFTQDVVVPAFFVLAAIAVVAMLGHLVVLIYFDGKDGGVR